MRILFHYLFAVSVLTLYGGQVCPFLVTLPSVLLGVIFLISFLGVLALRKPLERVFVLAAAGAVQPKRQFIMDFSLYLTAGFTVMVFNMIVFNFPVMSGLRVILGFGVAGFFLSLDMVLCRERAVINDAIAHNTNSMPPTRFSSMTRPFSMTPAKMLSWN